MRQADANVAEIRGRSGRPGLLDLVLYGIALHSFLTGLGLMLQPDALIAFGGWKPIHEAFFPAQGGVFHMLMAVLYARAAGRQDLRPALLPFILLVKYSAAVFLLGYYVFVHPVWLVLLSGLFDGAMAVTLTLLLRRPVSRELEIEEVP